VLREKAFYRIIALLALIILLSVAAVVIEKNRPYFLQIPHQEDQVINQQDSLSEPSGKTDFLHLKSLNKPEKKMFAGGDDPNMLKDQEKAESIKKQPETNKSDPVPMMNEEKLSDKNKAGPVKKKSSAFEVKKEVVLVDEPAPEAKAAIQPTIDLRYGRHKGYLRVVFDGPHEILTVAKVRHKDNEVSVTFPDTEFSLNKGELPLPFKREKNKVIFQKDNIEKIRVHNLSNPSRLAIDFYTKKAGSDQQKASNIEKKKDVKSEEVITEKTVVLEKAQPVSKTEDQKLTKQKREKPEIKSTTEIEVKATLALSTPTPELIIPTIKPEIMSSVKPVDEEKTQPVAQKNDQNELVQMKAEPAKKTSPAVEVKDPAIVSIASASEAEVQKAIKAEAKSVETEKSQSVSKTKDLKVADQQQDKPAIKATTEVAAKEPAALVIPYAPEVIVPTVKPVTISTAKTVEAEKSQPVEQKNEQKIPVLKKASPAVEVKEQAVVAVAHVSEAEVQQTIKYEAKPVETEKFQPVSKTKEQKLAVQEKEKPVIKSMPADAVNVPTVVVVSPIPEAQSTAVTPAEAVKTNTVSARPSENPKSVVVSELEKEPGAAKTFEGQDSSVVLQMAAVAGPAIEMKEKKERIALLPFDNFSGNYEALDKIMPLILNQLQYRDYDVIDYEEVEAYLCERSIRQVSSVSREVAIELRKNKMVNTVIAGSVLTFSTDGNPKIGILARRLDLKTGHIIWSDFVSITGEDYTRVLGLGTIKSIDMLIPNALNKLFADFGNRSPEKDSKAKYKIAVLPLRNESKHRHAGMIITHLFQNELANNPMFDPVDYGDVKKTIVNLRVRKKGEVDYNNLQALSKLLGVDVVLTGTVEEYQSGRDYSSSPRVTISARLLDSRRSRILWYDNLQLDGEENIIALDWGRLRSADKVAYGAVSGLVDNLKTEGLLR